jgi:hypothetical protein
MAAAITEAPSVTIGNVGIVAIGLKLIAWNMKAISR